jgi:hypothetical protein
MGNIFNIIDFDVFVEISQPFINFFIHLELKIAYHECDCLSRRNSEYARGQSSIKCTITFVLDNVFGNLDYSCKSVFGRWIFLNSGFDCVDRSVKQGPASSRNQPDQGSLVRG